MIQPQDAPAAFSPLSPAVKVLVDSPAEMAFDRFTKFVSEAFGVPVSLISIVDEARQFFKSATGLTEPWASRRETPLSHSFCQRVVSQGEVLAVSDARQDERVRGNLAITELGVIAYVGAPIYDDEGHAFGALCAIDTKPREWTKAEISLLRTMAEQVTNEVSMQQKLTRMGVDLDRLRMLEETRRQIARADRHDLRTPLNALMLNLKAIAEFGDINADQAECLRACERSAEELLSMVDNLLDIGNVDVQGRQALSIREVYVARLLSQAGYLIAALAQEKRIRLILPSVDPALTVPADEEKMGRVMQNLLANAVKFTPAGGKIEMNARVEGSHIRICVSDTGIGLTPESAAHIFDEGFRVDRTAPTRRSTGLGLTFCKRIVEAHGGTITVASAIGEGSTFTIRLPGFPS